MLWGNREERISQSRQISRNGSDWAGRGAVEQAAEAFQEAIRIWPADVRNYLELAHLYSQRNDHVAASETLAAGLRYDQNNVELRTRLAQSLLAQDRVEPALEQVQLVLQSNRDLGEAWLLRAKIRYRQGRDEEALADAYQAEAKQVTSDELLELLCQIYFRQGRPNRAWSIVQRLSARYPDGDRPTALVVLEAETLYQMNRKAEAIQTLQNWYHDGGDQDEQCCVMLATYHNEWAQETAQAATGNGPFAWNPMWSQVAPVEHPGWGQAGLGIQTPLAALYPINERPKFRPQVHMDLTGH
jgi:tetratricopeptide (TPR) repeat protein